MPFKSMSGLRRKVENTSAAAGCFGERDQMPKFCPEISKANWISYVIASHRSHFERFCYYRMKKDSLHYEMYGSSTASGKKGYWRWAIFMGREKKPLLVGSFYGPPADAKKHAEAAMVRLKERSRNRKTLPSK